MVRESRGSRGRFVFFVGCLAVGVAAIVAVAGLAAGLEAGIRTEARQLLAADLALSGYRKLPREVLKLLSARSGLELVAVKEMVTVVAARGEEELPGRSQLVELKVVGRGYPFYGKMDLAPDRPLAELLTASSTVAASDLLTRLELHPGEELLIGGHAFEVRGAVRDEPDRIGGAFSLGPRLFLSEEGLERSGLESFGSRILYRTLVKLPAGSGAEDADGLAEELRQLLPANGVYRVETFAEAQPALRQGLQRAGRFLGLVALLSLLVGGIGVAQTVRTWLAGRMEAIAILKCLGLRPREVVGLYLGQTVVLGFLGGLGGATIGTAVLLAAPRLLADLLPTSQLEVFQPAAILRGFALGISVALLFAFEPLLGVRRVPPLRVLRREVEPPPPNRAARLAQAVAILGGIYVAAAAQSGSAVRAAQFTAGVAAAALLLALAAWVGMKLLARFPVRRGRFWLRHGLAALARPGAPTLGAVTALGLGVLCIVGMSLVERTLSQELTAEIPLDSPNAFLIDIQPDQWAEVERLLEEREAGAIDSVPVVTARLNAIDGMEVSELIGESERRSRRWALRREQRLTYARALPDDNRVVEGALWGLEGVDEVSVEEDFAEDLAVGLGSVLRFDIQGTEIDLTVSSLRTVDWKTFGINFFLVVEPGVLEAAPQVRLAAARLPAEREQQIQDALAARFPNVTLIRTREVLEKVARVLGRLGTGVRFLGGFTVVAGMIILAGAVSAGAVRRGREIALLKTLGSTRGEIASSFLVEHSLLGLVAGITGVVGGSLLARAVVTRGFELSWEPQPMILITALIATVGLTALTSVAAGWSALRRRPMEVLRTE
jgi:putative ABC transport system permease protein